MIETYLIPLILLIVVVLLVGRFFALILAAVIIGVVVVFGADALMGGTAYLQLFANLESALVALTSAIASAVLLFFRSRQTQGGA